jgi:hypothetical protein
MPIAFLGVKCKMHAQNTACSQSTKNIDGFDLNGMEKYTCKVSSPKIEAAMSYNQNLFHFPSVAMCSTNALRNYQDDSIQKPPLCKTTRVSILVSSNPLI